MSTRSRERTLYAKAVNRLRPAIHETSSVRLPDLTRRRFDGEDEFARTVQFENTRAIPTAASARTHLPQLRLFANLGCPLHSWISEDGGQSTHIWGIPAHRTVPKRSLPEWCTEVVAAQQYDRFKELLGTFVVIVDESTRGRFTFVTDILGIRPMFIGRARGRLIFGSEVWSIRKAGLVSGRLDYDALSAWIVYGFNCTQGSLFADLQRLPAGSALVFESGEPAAIPYAEFRRASPAPAPEQVAEDIHDIVSSAVRTLLTDETETCNTVSGGYDSRYLLALTSSILPRNSITCVNVKFSSQEGLVAQRVADTLGLPLREVNVKGSIWDLYENVFYHTADGFPISKFVTHHVAQMFPGLVTVNGFMGDSLVRGSKDTFRGKYETEWTEGLADVLLQKHKIVRLDLFTKTVQDGLAARARVPMEQAVRKGSATGRVFGWADFYYRQRLYISNNFLGHLRLSEAIVPFYNWELLSYKMEHDCRAFNRSVYERIFRRHFPPLSEIPHADDLATSESDDDGHTADLPPKNWSTSDESPLG